MSAAKGAPIRTFSLSLIVVAAILGSSLDASATRWCAVRPNDGWTLTLRVSGGFAGVDRTLQVTNGGEVTAVDRRRSRTATSTASSTLLAELTDIDRRLTNAIDPAPSVCQDCLIYELTFRPETGRSRVWRLDDQTREPADLVGLVKSLADALNGALAQ